MDPGTISEEIDNELINDPNIKESNERFYIYPQQLYTRLLISKQNLKFGKPNWMGEDTYKYEWLRIYTAILNQLLVDLGNVCDSKSCLKMTAGSDWKFLCMVHNNKKGIQCCPVDYCMHNLESFQKLLTDHSYYCDRINIKGKGVQVFPQIFKFIHRIIAYTYYTHKDFFNKYEEKYRHIVSMRDCFSFVENIKYLKKNTSLLNKKFIEVKFF
jgi:hypothetical protein